MYWTDSAQARDRLEGSYVMLKKDPVYVRHVTASTTPELEIQNVRTSARDVVPIGEFGSFRNLPPLGWVNLVDAGRPSAAYVRRLPIRGRKHGLTLDGCKVYVFNASDTLQWTRDYLVSDVFNDPGYIMTVDNDFPSYQEVFDNTPRGSGVAFSRNLAIYHDRSGMKWLYRGAERIGFVEKGGVNLFDLTKFYVESLREEPSLVTVPIV